jgi:hypothetical protein
MADKNVICHEMGCLVKGNTIIRQHCCHIDGYVDDQKTNEKDTGKAHYKFLTY